VTALWATPCRCTSGEASSLDVRLVLGLRGKRREEGSDNFGSATAGPFWSWWTFAVFGRPDVTRRVPEARIGHIEDWAHVVWRAVAAGTSHIMSAGAAGFWCQERIAARLRAPGDCGVSSSSNTCCEPERARWFSLLYDIRLLKLEMAGMAWSNVVGIIL
jgi:hypothetical protein